MKWRKENLSLILNLSVMTSLQQSIMNFGILMVQGLVNSFGTVIMAAFAAAVKIDSFAYMPVQDFGNAFSTYVAQNYGANEKKRIKDGIKSAVIMSMVFCVFVSLLVSIFAKPLMQIFIDSGETQIIAVGVHYLRIEGACYVVLVVWILQGGEPAIDVCDLDDCFAWHTSSAGLCIVSDSGDWGYWDLDGGADWVVFGGCDRNLLLFSEILI